MTDPLSWLAPMAGGVVLGMAFLLAWTWWTDVRDDVTWAAFWRPVRDVTMHGKPWLQVHLVAHLLGGVAYGCAINLLDISTFGVSLTDTVWKRLLWILPVQALWERVQHENFESWTQYIKPDGTVVARRASAYPWWSAVWDVQLTLAGWALVELGRLAWHWF